MSDPIQRTASGADDPAKRRNWFAQRSGRKEYWIYTGVATALWFALPALGFDQVNIGLSAIIFLIQVRRFHDLGHSGWWAVALMVVCAVIGLALGVPLEKELALRLTTLLSLVPMLVLGVLPGQPHENKWGPPPGRKPLAETFS